MDSRLVLLQDPYAHPIAGVAFVFAVLAAVAGLGVALSPSIAFDPLAVHLAAARYYAAQHALVTLPAVPDNYFPQGCEVLMALAWSLGGQPATQLVAPLFWILTLLLLFLIGRACGLNNAAAFAGMVAAALLAFLRELETRGRTWIPVGALLLGSTFAIKHVALFGAAPLLCFFLYASRRLRVALVFCGVAAVSALNWHARTAWLTGNPVYPAAMSQTWTQGHPRVAGQSRLPRFWRIPWRAQFDGDEEFESLLPNPMGIALLVFPPLAILVRGPSTPARRACLLFCAV